MNKRETDTTRKAIDKKITQRIIFTGSVTLETKHELDDWTFWLHMKGMTHVFQYRMFGGIDLKYYHGVNRKKNRQHARASNQR